MELIVKTCPGCGSKEIEKDFPKCSYCGIEFEKPKLNKITQSTCNAFRNAQAAYHSKEYAARQQYFSDVGLLTGGMLMPLLCFLQK